MKVHGGGVENVPALYSNQEEADERIMLHINHGHEAGLKRLLLVSADTDVFVSAVSQLQYRWCDLFVFIKIGCRKTSKVFPLHLLKNYISGNTLAIVPAVHALTGCDTTSKVGRKLDFLKKPLDLELLDGFGIGDLTPEKIKNAEKFLVTVTASKTESVTFDTLRYEQFHNFTKLDFKRRQMLFTSILSVPIYK